MGREDFDDLPSGVLSDEDLARLTEYAKTRTKAFVSMWTPDQVLVQRFSEVAEEVIRLRKGVPDDRS